MVEYYQTQGTAQVYTWGKKEVSQQSVMILFAKYRDSHFYALGEESVAYHYLKQGYNVERMLDYKRGDPGSPDLRILDEARANLLFFVEVKKPVDSIHKHQLEWAIKNCKLVDYLIYWLDFDTTNLEKITADLSLIENICKRKFKS